MILIMLIALTILLSLIAIGFTIGGLIKNKKKVWITSLILTVVFIMTTVFSIAVYIKRKAEYLTSEEFQEETRKSAEQLGRTWGNTVSGTAKGLEESIDDDAILKLASKGAKLLGNGVKVVAAGFDETTAKTKIFSDESISLKGISVGRAELLEDSVKISYGLFLDFSEDYEGTLELTAYDNEGLKMDHTMMEFNEKKGAAKVHVFQFDYFKPGLNGYCILKEKSDN